MIVKDLSNSFHPLPKNKRIENKKLLQEKTGKCQVCGKKSKTEMHHIKTRGSGGNDTEENLVEVCRICHTKIHKGNIPKEKLKDIKNTKRRK